MYLSFPLNCIPWYAFAECFLTVQLHTNKEGRAERVAGSLRLIQLSRHEPPTEAGQVSSLSIY